VFKIQVNALKAHIIQLLKMLVLCVQEVVHRVLRENASRVAIVNVQIALLNQPGASHVLLDKSLLKKEMGYSVDQHANTEEATMIRCH
jgi:hypothetical protein